MKTQPKEVDANWAPAIQPNSQGTVSCQLGSHQKYFHGSMSELAAGRTTLTANRLDTLCQDEEAK